MANRRVGFAITALWFSDWGAQEIIAVDLWGQSEVVIRVPFPSIPMCIDFLPDGRLLVVSSHERRLMCREPDGSLVTHADLSGLSGGINEIVMDGRGNAYVNGAGFNLLAGEKFAPGFVGLVTPDGSVRQVADGMAFPNGMIVTPDNSTLIVAESYGKRLTAFDIASWRQLVKSASVGRLWRRRTGRYLSGRGKRHLVRGRSKQVLRPCARRW